MKHISFFFPTAEGYAQVTSCESNRTHLMSLGAVLTAAEAVKPVEKVAARPARRGQVKPQE